MNDQKFETKMEKDAADVKKAAVRMASDGVSHIKDELNDFTSTLKDNADGAATSIRKDINHGMSQYNSKVQGIAERFHVGMNQNVSKYPWVVITMGLFFGFMLGILVKPSHQSR